MAHVIETGADALVVDPKDDVATALRDLTAGETVQYRSGHDVTSVQVKNDIPFGHKLAIRDMETGTHVRKYGEVIGQSTMAIQTGEHVHVHNVEGIRGRGDQAAQEKGTN
ncbi:UxaA family hydrolase [Paenibacillus mendelii]|uniref:UxaA family hydrolase n=1 Tax=Paenibacillus mendelii TaxID=206163 RepID=A0ABV6JAA6_9BACL|nr:UxaA family hydrolase [Paenibacillus mendelii]MCQ6560789.1 UxaA family hydrolase [Paenibacillus mendelii]